MSQSPRHRDPASEKKMSLRLVLRSRKRQRSGRRRGHLPAVWLQPLRGRGRSRRARRRDRRGDQGDSLRGLDPGILRALGTNWGPSCPDGAEGARIICTRSEPRGLGDVELLDGHLLRRDERGHSTSHGCPPWSRSILPTRHRLSRPVKMRPSDQFAASSRSTSQHG